MIALPAGSFALVTGASAGIGEAIARGLARRKVPLLLVARSGEKLVALADELRALSGVAVEAIVLDLASEGAAERLVAATEGAGRPVGLLVNNAAFGFYGPQEEQELERTLRMIKLNVETLVELTHRLLGADARAARRLRPERRLDRGLPPGAVHGASTPRRRRSSSPTRRRSTRS